jgi:3-methyladenine DNA glycosylase AlkC
VHPLANRKPARSRAEIPPAVLSALSRGEIETANLVEGLALDFQILLLTAFPNLLGVEALDASTPYTHRLKRAAALVWDQCGERGFSHCLGHASDTLRGIAAYIVPLRGDRTASHVLEAIRPLAADPHFGVREWAWLGIRPLIVAEPREYIKELDPWVHDGCLNIRRFATESTRPRGVWCSHIHLLRSEPEIAIGLLEPLKADSTKYVQDSVANWLNDASKTRPEWVLQITGRWLDESDSDFTRRIVGRARRSINSS